MRVLITNRTLFDKNHQPIRFGRMLVESLVDSSYLVVLADDPARTRQDLFIHNIPTDSIEVVEYDPDLSLVDNILKIKGSTRFDCLIDSDPAIATWAYSQGINCLLALEPKFMDPRFRPDGKGVVSWAHLLDEIESQSRMLSEKREGWEKSGFNSWE